MFKTVKSAKIEVITPSELQIGDYILWANQKRKVLKINNLNRFFVISNPSSETTESLPTFLHYYKIVSCEETETNNET
jgi:hypothetical protein